MNLNQLRELRRDVECGRLPRAQNVEWICVHLEQALFEVRDFAGAEENDSESLGHVIKRMVANIRELEGIVEEPSSLELEVSELQAKAEALENEIKPLRALKEAIERLGYRAS